MGTMPVGRLLLSMSLPIAISMLVQALYNVVDSIFVAQISETALTAVSLAFPFQNLMISVSVGTGVGMNALLSRHLGERAFTEANQTASNGVFLTLLNCLLFLTLGLTCARPFFTAQVVADENAEQVVALGVEYLSICAGLSCGLFLEMTMERLLQSTGKTIFSMITQMSGAVINIILDWILIFGRFGLPRRGVAGAALATVIGQIAAAGLALFFHLRFNHEVHLETKSFRPSWTIIRRIYSVGLPSIVMNSISSVMIFGMNKILYAFTSTAAAVLGVYFKIQNFVFLPVFGLNNGMIPIVAYNYGARHKDRLMKAVGFSMMAAVCVMLVGLAGVQTFAADILLRFKASPDMIALGVPALRIISLSFVFAGIGIVSAATFQALGSGLLSMTVSIVRQMVVLLPAAWLLSLSGEVNLIWWAFPIAEFVSLALCAVFLWHIYQNTVRPLKCDD